MADRPVLPNPEQRPGGRVPTGWYPPLVGLVVFVIALVVAVQFFWPPSGATTARQTAPLIAPAPSPTVATIEVAGRQMVDLGPLFAPSPDGAVVSSEAREDLLVVQTTGPMLLDFSSWQLVAASDDAFELTKLVGSQRIYLSAEAVGGTTFARGGPGILFQLVSAGAQGGTILFSAGPARQTSGLHVELDAGNHLYVAQASDPNVAVVSATGEALNLEGASPIGRAPASGGFVVVNECTATATPPCHAVVFADSPGKSDGYDLPDGAVSCSERDATRIEFGTTSLLFTEVDATGRDHLGCLPLATQYFNNDGSFHPPPIALSYTTNYRITAETANGRPLSVVVGNDRTMYAGDFAPQVRCPCRTTR